MRKRPLVEINVVPYIDVMLVLLVIFMITVLPLTQGIHVKLPQAAEKKLVLQKEIPVIISIDSQGNDFLNIAKEPYQPITKKDLIIRITTALKLAKQNHQKRKIYVKGDKKVDYGKVVQVMVLLQRAGADSVELITQTSSTTKSKILR
ncbi:ExbD/TolR family protein [Coxiella endosymbiont of Dermacentor marginatus]|uniref:ExbD/TolR family protein n=1 Tax=Coxiella endosymbiont of Dermacentor marginatus TaxID=1656159 RepID=UPI00222247A8|nr:ExbD/TolR family protein [Coxiella endosymbiont of Dermacentor marginatus]